MSHCINSRAAFSLAVTVIVAACGGTEGPSEPGGSAAVASVQVTLANPTLTALGQTAQLSAAAKDAQGRTLSGKTVSWTSSSAQVASVSATGLVTAVANGSTTIRATVDGVSGSVAVTVAQQVQAVAVTPATNSLTSVGATVQLAAAATDANGNAVAGASVTWTSSATAVATVNASGLVTAVANGTATITATAGGVNGTASVVVGQAAATVTVSPGTASLDAFGKTRQFTATVRDANGNTIASPVVTWSTSSAGVATVNSSGLATAVSNGTATITASSGGQTGGGALTVAQVVTGIVFSVQPPNGFADSTLTPTVQVDLRDANGNRATNSSASVTAAIGVNPRGGVLSGTATRTAAQGRATFTGLSITKAGKGYTLKATSGALTVESQTFDLQLNPKNAGTAVTSVALGSGGTSATVQVGSAVHLDIGFQVWNQTACPGCISQVMVGFGNTVSACAYSSTPGLYPGASTGASGNIPTPGAAGTYLLRFKQIQEFTCNDAFGAYNANPPNSEAALGTLVVTDPSNVTVAPSNIKLNNSPLLSVVKGGQTVTLAMGYQVWNQTGCPGCITQVVIGIDNAAKACAYNSTPGTNPGATGTASLSLAAPTTPGTYDVRYKATQQFTCADGQASYNASPPTTNQAIETIVVIP